MEGILCENYALVGAMEVLWTCEASDDSVGGLVGIGGAGTGALRGSMALGDEARLPAGKGKGAGRGRRRGDLELGREIGGILNITARR